VARPLDRIRSSPRLQRRLLWSAGAGAVVAGIALVVVLLPGTAAVHPASPAPAAGIAAEPVAQTTHTRVPPGERRAIDRLLDRFVPAALERKSAAVAWALSGPELTSASTLAQWRAGTSPVQPYPARGATFHDWTALDVTPDSVTFNLLIQPRPGARVAPYVFSGEAIRQGSRWLVNRWYTIAIMNPVRGTTHEIGPLDFGAPGRGDGASKPVLGKLWLLPVLALLGIVVLTPVVLAVGALVRARRWRRHVVATGRTQLPPLPRRSPVEAPREPAGG